MENLEKYITDNLDQFNCGQMPEGHQERFLARLAAAEAAGQTEHPRSGSTATSRIKHLFSRKRLFAASSAAAAIIIALFATLGNDSREERYTTDIQKLAREMYQEEAELLQMFQEDEQYMVNNIKSITEEATPLADQLPPELSPARRAEILREYYKAKTAGLRQIKTLYAQSNQPID